MYIFYRHARFYSLYELEDLLIRFRFKLAAIRATLSYSPPEEHRIEEPYKIPEGIVFVCIEAEKLEDGCENFERQDMNQEK
jgi:hypothetical protein